MSNQSVQWRRARAASSMSCGIWRWTGECRIHLGLFFHTCMYTVRCDFIIIERRVGGGGLNGMCIVPEIRVFLPRNGGRDYI